MSLKTFIHFQLFDNICQQIPMRVLQPFLPPGFFYNIRPFSGGEWPNCAPKVVFHLHRSDMMALINPKSKEVHLKIVYYGPGRGGKTNNLEYIYRHMRANTKSQLVSLETKDDRTLFFDYFPLDVGSIYGYSIRLNLYTIPGQVKYNATRKLVLRGADGIVFVADSISVTRKKNITSFHNLDENLKNYNRNIAEIPIVFQYNKRDLMDKGIPLLSINTLENDLNARLKAPWYGASALTGENVGNTLKKIVTMTIGTVRKQQLIFGA